MNKVRTMGLSSSFSFSIVFFLYRWKTLSTQGSKSNTLAVVFWANHPETSTRAEFLGWEVLFLWLFTCYQWRVNTNSLKYVMKKKNFFYQKSSCLVPLLLGCFAYSIVTNIIFYHRTLSWLGTKPNSTFLLSAFLRNFFQGQDRLTQWCVLCISTSFWVLRAP